MSPSSVAPSRPVAVVTPRQVMRLQAVREQPCVSVLLSTTPAPVMTGADAARLRHLVDRAQRRLADENAPLSLRDELRRLAEAATAGPTATGLALFVSAGTAEAVHLPIAVRDRDVVDPTFATRDLVRSLHRTPRHVVLVLTSREARLFDGAGGSLRPAPTPAFPRTDQRRRATDASRPGRKNADTSAFLRTVDAALGTYLRLRPAPLVLVGPERVTARFTELSANVSRLAGAIDGNLARATLAELADRVRPVLERYLLSREQEALDLLDRRAGAGRVASGMPAAWLAARRERPEMLAVEEGLFYPARISEDGDTLSPADDVEHPEVIDDAVDELIELVLDRGGWIAIVEDDRLADHGRVALTIRTRH